MDLMLAGAVAIGAVLLFGGGATFWKIIRGGNKSPKE